MFILFFWRFEVYYESIKREPKIRGIKKCRCDERLQTKTKEFTRLPYTGLLFNYNHNLITADFFFLFHSQKTEDLYGSVGEMKD